MRKKIRQQKEAIQLSLFDRQVISVANSVNQTSGTRNEAVGVSQFFSLLARNRALTKDMLEEVLSITNLNKAYEQVRRNNGASGVDGMGVSELGSWLKANGKELISQIKEESYMPSVVLGIKIPKADGGERLLGIPTAIDRLLQQSIHEILSKLYEPLFSDHSYGFRPGRSAQQAIKQSSIYVKQGSGWVVDIDLARFFDEINHDRLMQRLHMGIGDKGVLRLIRKYLQAGMLKDGLAKQRLGGTPQGGPLSPLLSNIVLDELDKELEKRGHQFVRYADDCNIYVKSKRAGERTLDSITKFIEQKLKLKINKAKSGVRRCEETKFLGHTILENGKIRIADKSIIRFKKKVIELTKRNRGVKFSEIIESVNTLHRGWVNYFKLANSWLPWRELDGWVRRRMRCYRLKQCGRKYTIFKFLRKLEAPINKAWNAIMYSGGWWNLSSKMVCTKAMDLNWFDRNGLQSLTNLFARYG